MSLERRTDDGIHPTDDRRGSLWAERRDCQGQCRGRGQRDRRPIISYGIPNNSHVSIASFLSSEVKSVLNLIIALARAAGNPARYVHGTAKFYSSGHILGHVWTQVYVDGYWCCFDTCCTLNKFGHIGGWNYKTYTLHGTYQFLPF